MCLDVRRESDGRGAAEATHPSRSRRPLRLVTEAAGPARLGEAVRCLPYFFFAARFAGFEVLRALVEAAFALLALLFFAPPLRAPLDFVALLRAVLAAPRSRPRFVPLLDFAPEVLDEVVLLLALAFGVEVLGSLMALPAASFILVMAD